MSDEYGYIIGRCDPKGGVDYVSGQKTFSVGIFKWRVLPNGSRRRGTAILRVSGAVRRRAQVYKEVKRLCKLLNEGRYSGSKSIHVTW